MNTAKIIIYLMQSGVSIDEIALKCNVSILTVERWLKGKFKPTRANKKYLDQWQARKLKEANAVKT